MRTICVLVAVAACSLFAAEEKTVEQKTFTVARAPRLDVDNIHGSIRVVAHDRAEVRVTAHKTIYADTQDALAQARSEVRLDMSQQSDTVRLYVDGPFRCDCNCDGSAKRGGNRHWRNPGYTVRYDFDIRAPRDTAVSLRTVNDGEIRVDGAGGNFDLENVNGGIELLDTAGSGRVHTVNGPIKVTFRENPRAASSFATINGEVELYFQPNLSADLRMKTFNGGIYSDFPMTALPAEQTSGERRNGRFVFKADRFAGARVGNGGPEIKLDGFNGDIRILERR